MDGPEASNSVKANSRDVLPPVWRMFSIHPPSLFSPVGVLTPKKASRPFSSEVSRC